MGWGTEFKVDVFLSKETYQTIDELRNVIAQDDEYLNRLKQKILMYASSNVKDIVPNEWGEESINFIHNNVESLLYELEEAITLRYRRTLYLEYLLKQL